MAKYRIEIQAKKGQPASIMGAPCPLCQTPIGGWEMKQEFEEHRPWDAMVVAHVATTKTIEFRPCNCLLRLPPDELEIIVGPKDDPGLLALSEIVAEALNDEHSQTKQR